MEMEQSEKLGVLDSEKSNYFFLKILCLISMNFIAQEFYLKTETI